MEKIHIRFLRSLSRVFKKNKLTKELHKAVNQQFKGFEVYFSANWYENRKDS